MAVLSTLAEIELDFSYFDNLYSGQDEQYAEMLDLYLQEYLIYKRTISEAIVNGDEAEFRKAKHKIIYSLHLLKLEAIKSHLDEIGVKMSGLNGSELQLASRVMDGLFDNILIKLSDKKSKTL